jgi:hypothetical protein
MKKIVFLITLLEIGVSSAYAAMEEACRLRVVAGSQKRKTISDGHGTQIFKLKEANNNLAHQLLDAQQQLALARQCPQCANTPSRNAAEQTNRKQVRKLADQNNQKDLEALREEKSKRQKSIGEKSLLLEQLLEELKSHLTAKSRSSMHINK